MDFGMAKSKTIISSPTRRYSTLRYYPSYSSNNKQSQKQHIPLTERQSQRPQPRTKPPTQNHAPNAFLQTIDVQNVYVAIVSQKQQQNASNINQLTKCLNGTWFKSIMTNQVEFAAKSLYSNLAVRKRSHPKKTKANPQIIQTSLPERQYKQPNLFPGRPFSSISMYTQSHQKGLSNDQISFRSMKVQGRGIDTSKNEGWLKDQIVRSVSGRNRTVENRERKLMKVQGQGIKNNQNKQTLGLLCSKAKLNQ